MHKSTSDNMQNRAVRAILNDRSNHHLDDTAFSGLKDVEHRRTILAQQKQAVEARIGGLNARIQRANDVRKAGGCGTRPATVGGWKVERAGLLEERAKIEIQLQAIGAYSKAAREERMRSFDNVFVDIAREMLAAAVFERLQMATIHRIQERAASEPS